MEEFKKGNIENEIPGLETYTLNFKKASIKKLKNTTPNIHVIQKKGNNLVIKFNTGCYELVKCLFIEFFIENISFFIEKKSYYDKEERETKTVVTINESSNRGRKTRFLYTINFYNTTSNMLVNGQNAKHFKDFELPQILEAIELYND